jgi:hypothetical protein
VKDPNSLQQELINIVVWSLGLKPLEGKAKENCQKGHEMEPIFSQQLLAAAGCPWGQIEEIDKVGLVQKAGMKHMKESVDRIACMSNNSGDKELLLVEFKARVKPETAQAEEERIDALWSNGLMDDESIFCEITLMTQTVLTSYPQIKSNTKPFTMLRCTKRIRFSIMLEIQRKYYLVQR